MRNSDILENPHIWNERNARLDEAIDNKLLTFPSGAKTIWQAE